MTLPPTRWTALGAIPAALALVATGCGEQRPSAPQPRAAPGVFSDVSAESGVDFVHETGAEGEYRFPEIMGSGVALFDYDGDGDLDLYLVQGARWNDAGGGAPFRNRLFRNDLVPSSAGSRASFVDVTVPSGAGDPGYGMGVVVGDVDSDGDLDLYVANFGANALYRNDGDGTFKEIGDSAGVADGRWSTSGSFFDYDGDGDLDLFHANYVAFAEDVGRVCSRPAGDRDYCTPLAYRPQPDSLYRNRGNGTFDEVTTAAGLDEAFGNGLGAVAADFDGDGRPDLYVANDGVANQLWINQGDGTFRDGALLAGVAFNGDGEPEAGMGIALGDVDGDRDLDLFLTHLSLETNTLYLNDGGGVFRDASTASVLGRSSRPMTGFGTYFLDYDSDGLLDLLVVNGAVTKVDSQLGEEYPYMMPNQLFRGTAAGRFEDVSDRAGSSFALLESTRGAAIGDIDLDGDLDAVISNNRGRARVLRNDTASGNRWLSVLDGGATGATIEVEGVGLSPLVRIPRTDGSYCSARDPRAYFGLATAESAAVVLHRVDGKTVRWRSLPVDRHLNLEGAATR